MLTEETYQLCGYIDYVPQEQGFITPVFSMGYAYFLQTTSDDNTISHFEVLPDISITDLTVNSQPIYRKEGDSCIFGFKDSETVYYDEGQNLANYLRNVEFDKFKNEYLIKNIKSFIHHYSTEKIERKNLDLNDCWSLCNSVVKAQFSFEFCRQFQEFVIPIKFESNILTLSFSNRSFKTLFDNSLKSDLVTAIQSVYEVDIHIESIESPNDLINWRIGEINEPGFSQGSFVIHTHIQPRHTYDFESFFIGENNSNAYETSIKIASSGVYMDPAGLIIYGDRGSGKTHLLRAIANYLNRHNWDNIPIFTMDRRTPQVSGIPLRNISEFEIIINEAKMILIDDAHLFDEGIPFQGKYWDLIKSQSRNGKKVICTYNISYAHEELNHSFSSFIEDFEKVSLNRPDFRDKINLIKYKSRFKNLWIDDGNISSLAQILPDNVAGIERGLTWVYLDCLASERNLIDCKYSFWGNDRGTLKHHRRDIVSRLPLLKDLVSKFIDLQTFHSRYTDIVYNEKVRAVNDLTIFLIELYYYDMTMDDALNKHMKVSKDYSFHYFQHLLYSNLGFKNSIVSIHKEYLRNLETKENN
ncbi:DnaA ATPase domain-containing protein [Paradesertivirga mongoliensis]|uniref:DnaA ATPase domain-containing protein n=1 Tax=Paradesertivirga mongoliensis TaxID=2100740 RepID=A0ABW4ZJK7_9SPHI|nr:DnaA/Hda family protein [Pedobacter mongoliensis]